MNSSRAAKAIAALVAVVLVGGIAFLVVRLSGEDTEPTAAEEQAAADGTQFESEPATWPLTGLKVQGEDDGAQPFPAYVVKIDNTESSAPQRGLSQADMVVEELVEGGSTRLAAFFYTRLPQVVGPVRSIRATDIGVVSPARATVVASGAAAPTIKRVSEAGITVLNETNANLYRDDGRAAPYNLFADLAAIGERAAEDHPDPDDYFTWGRPTDLPQGKKATGLDASFGEHTTTWRLEDGRYRNVNAHAASDEQFVADTVVVMRVQVGDAGYRDPAGNVVPETELTGEGPMSLLHGGRQVSGTWSKEDPRAPFVLTSGGQEIPVPAGHTWVELVPAEDGNASIN